MAGNQREQGHRERVGERRERGRCADAVQLRVDRVLFQPRGGDRDGHKEQPDQGAGCPAAGHEKLMDIFWDHWIPSRHSFVSIPGQQVHTADWRSRYRAITSGCATLTPTGWLAGRVFGGGDRRGWTAGRFWGGGDRRGWTVISLRLVKVIGLSPSWGETPRRARTCAQVPQ